MMSAVGVCVLLDVHEFNAGGARSRCCGGPSGAVTELADLLHRAAAEAASYRVTLPERRVAPMSTLTRSEQRLGAACRQIRAHPVTCLTSC